MVTLMLKLALIISHNLCKKAFYVYSERRVTMEGKASRDWNHSVEEPELEFDDMGMELAAHDGMLNYKWICLILVRCFEILPVF